MNPAFAGESVRYEAQRHTVIAVTQSGRFRPVLENMAMMPAAARAMVFRARHEQFAVCFGLEGVVDTRKKTWPTGTAIKLHIRREQRLTASGANECSPAVLVVERTGEAALCAFLPQHLVLLPGQLLTPFLI